MEEAASTANVKYSSPIKKSILLVEDDKSILEYLRELMLDNGFSVNTASDGVKAISLLKKIQPDVVLLDLGLPNLSGETVCLEVKKNYPHIPVLILTAKDTTPDVVSGFGLGADDYITKPFNADELLARIKARLRQTNSDGGALTVGDLVLDRETLEVKRGDRLIELTPKEFKLLEYLMSNKGRVLTRDMILNKIWLYSPDIESRVVDVYMGYLRKKIDLDEENKLIHSARGFGYMIKD